MIYDQQKTAVLTTLYKSDRLDYMDVAISSIELQAGLEGHPRIYLCCDGPLPTTHNAWLQDNADRFYRIIRNERNMGLRTALNRLIDILEDEAFVFRMDGDDVSDPDRFITQIRYMQAHPDIALVGCQARDIDEAGMEIGLRNFPQTAAACSDALIKLNPVLHPTFCMRGNLLRDSAIRYPDAYLSEDLAFLVLLAERGYLFANVPERLFNWRLDASFFARRRSLWRGLTELHWYTRAVRAKRGFLSTAYLYPIARLGLRMMPIAAQSWIYRSALRNKISGGGQG
ncbi:glycosyltransferase [Pseudophaeobacter arcticus]|uniref:glycosyltransferase n=1 Tax=Pseudophaeobacter arcticus TaxID=385492 RepID=UPI000488BCB9|nr:glycosyltransferase [Pseudophaeobacter arcticus]